MPISRRMKAAAQLIVLAASCETLAAGTTSGAAAMFKCWTNKDGVKECGNAVPPEYAQQGHTAHNAQGLTVSRQAQAKSQEQFIEEQRLQEQKAVAAREEEARKHEDRVLTQTFSSEDDLLLARDGRVSEVEGQIRLTESRNAKLNVNLQNLIKSAADLERSGKPVDESVTNNVENLRKHLADNQAFIARKRREADDIRQKFDADLTRWRELRAAR